MQRYATAAAQSNTIDQDTIHLLFPGLNKLLNFQRRFLIKLESIWELPWNERQWGAPFTEFVRCVLACLSITSRTARSMGSRCGYLPYMSASTAHDVWTTCDFSCSTYRCSSQDYP